MQDHLDASTIIVRTAVFIIVAALFFFVLKSDKNKKS